MPGNIAVNLHFPSAKFSVSGQTRERMGTWGEWNEDKHRSRLSSFGNDDEVRTDAATHLNCGTEHPLAAG